MALGVLNDTVDLLGDFIPLADVLVNKISEQTQIHKETEVFSPEEFAEYKKLYFLPDGLRAMVFCFMESRR